MTTYTVSVTGAGRLAPRFEQLLDVLPAAAMEGDDSCSSATLWFDVVARDAEAARERAFERIAGLLRNTALDEALAFVVVKSSTVPGRLPWWRRMVRR